jgi:short-subunit dehydrogenase
VSSNSVTQAGNEGFSRERHGPWAVIAGASDGLGAEFARHAAAAGIHVILIARRLPALQTLAADLSSRYGVEAIPVSLDLSTPDATERMLAAVGNREIGLLVFNAGADTSGKRFNDLSLSEWEALVRRNVNTLMSACYQFSQRMLKVGRGGILLVSSNASFGGGARVGIYTATKAFGLNLGESLWAELSPHNIDVLNLVFATASTPTFNGVLEKHGIPVESVGAVPTPEQVASAAVAAIRRGPTFIYGSDEKSTDPFQSNMLRRQRVEGVSQFMNTFYGNA